VEAVSAAGSGVQSISSRKPTSQELRVNIGCGTAAAEGWVNFDNSPTILVSRLKLGKRLFGVPQWPANVHRHDVLKGLPFEGDRVSYIYSSHTFEHFTFRQALSVAKECFRVLRQGGVLRIAVPDLKGLIRDYENDPDPLASHRFVERLLLQHSWRDALHPGAHHSQMFDSRSLQQLFRLAGFACPRECGFRESAIPDISNIELESRRSESLYVEAEKPGGSSPGQVV
jgi:predicted SAM-dependent methyltransferase